MKIIFASDIHGSLKYTKKLEEYINIINPDKIVLLGDLLYHGARNPLPDEYDTIKVTQILNKYKDKITAVRGNCDSEVDDIVTEFDTRKDFKIIEIDNKEIVITHGHLNPYLHEIINKHITIQGHTHIYNLEGNILNPGSVGIPKVNKEHTCMLYQNNKFSIIDLDNFKEIISKEIQ